jgi:integrase/recombinase XerD
MSELHRHVEDYLRLRRALGFKLRMHGLVLPQFADYLEAAGVTTPTTELAVSFAQLPVNVQPIQWAQRLTMVRGFARYLKTIDPATEVPPDDVFGARYQRPTPYLWQEDEVLCLMEAAGKLQPPLRALTYETLFGLLWTTGMRIGEALALERSDVDLTAGVLTIREAKDGRSRLVPLEQSATEALDSYALRRDRLCPAPKSAAFFVTGAGRSATRGTVESTFDKIATAIGLRTETKRPRIHDLRHTFAVRVLVSWYRSGVDVGKGMGLLATYLGHVNPLGTYWYLSASPELIELIAARLEERPGGGER